MLSFFALDVLDEILDLIESVSGGFLPTPVYAMPNSKKAAQTYDCDQNQI